MKGVVKKLKQNNGFTISELLVATLIVLLTSGMLITCIQLGMKQLYKQTQKSEAQMLCTMLSTAVQDELSYASNVEMIDVDGSSGKHLTFTKKGVTDKVGFYIASETSSDTDESTFEYVPVTNDSASARDNLGKIYLASVDASNTITNHYGLVSTGAYNIENSKYGSLQTGMVVKETTGGYEVKIEVFNGTDISNALATKDFYVGKIASTVNADVDTTVDDETFTLTFDPNGGLFKQDGSTSPKTYTNVLRDTVFSVPDVTHASNYEFDGWLSSDGEKIYTGSVTVTKDMTYVAQWKHGVYTAKFYKDAETRDNHPDDIVASVSANYGNIIGGMMNDVTIYWPGSTESPLDSYHAAQVQKDGYIFDGWIDTSGNVYLFANGEHGDIWTYTKEEKFIPHYTPVYTASFYRSYDSSDNPTDLIERRTVTYNTRLEFPTAPTWDGRIFIGWEYERAVNDKVTLNPYETGMTYTFEKDMDFVATWDEYTLTFYNGNTMIGKAIYHPNSNSYTYTDEITAGELSFDAANWTFNGWYSDPENEVREFDENGDATPENTILETLSSTNRNIDLYAGWTNANAMYYKTDVLQTGSYFLIVGGDDTGNYRRALTDNGNNTTTANVTVRGNDTERYVVYQNALDAYDWYLDGNNYIRKSNNDKILDVNNRGKLIVKNDGLIDSARHWQYTNHALVGSWGVFSNRYVYFSNNSFENTTDSVSNGNIHIYEYKDVGEILSFNGYSQ